MAGQENDKKWNRTDNSSTEGPPKASLARKKPAAYFVDGKPIQGLFPLISRGKCVFFDAGGRT